MRLVSGLFNTDAMNFVDCPKCMQPAGTCCVNHRGKKLPQVHPERADAYRVKFKDRARLYAGKSPDLSQVHAYNAKLLK
jgi:hypothetical protein